MCTSSLAQCASRTTNHLSIRRLRFRRGGADDSVAGGLNREILWTCESVAVTGRVFSLRPGECEDKQGRVVGLHHTLICATALALS